VTIRAVIFTGARDHPYPEPVYARLDGLYAVSGPFTLYHGACKRRGSEELAGADRYADEWGRRMPGVRVEPRPADWGRWQRRAGPIRNRDMVTEVVFEYPRSEILGVAFPGPDSSGTVDCIKRMREFEIEVDVWDPDRVRQWMTEYRMDICTDGQ
jgi:hypothetical protein